MDNPVVKALVELLRENPEGLTDEVIERELPYVPLDERALGINTLLQQRLVQLFKHGDSLMYKPVSRDQAVQFKGLTPEDMLLYQTIKESNTKGIWTRDMKMKTSLQQPQITKILKTLEGRKLIKAVKSVAGKNKKVYMLFDLEPSNEVTGGSWYTNSEFDRELIAAVRESCLAHVIRQGADTLTGVVDAVRRSGAAGRDTLALEDYKQVLSTLVFDNEVETYTSTGTGKDSKFPLGLEVYRVCKSRVMERTPLTSVPCGVCPVVSDCCDGGVVSPQTCVYFQKWLQF